MKKGFTLIELLVVIAIIAIIVGFAMPNFLGVRQRANDLKKKSELQQLKKALRLYYNDYQQYPTTTNNMDIKGCGTSVLPAAPSTSCGTSFDANSVTYMNNIPDFNGSTGLGYGFLYCPVTGGDDFRMWVTLDNLSDADLASSQTRCSVGCSGLGAWGTLDYVVCAD